MAAKHKPDAIFSATNLMTLGALRALRELRLRIPQDVALVGFDDMPWAEELVVPLTAIAQPTYDLGQQAVQLLLRRLESPGAPFETVILPTTLIIRESCGAAQA
jgi:DNA-binding LacI/PurR family transcriptional regulator